MARSPKSDPQRERAYKWEWTYGYSQLKMFDNIIGPRKWVRWACKQFGVDPPVVRRKTKARDGNFSVYWRDEHVIELLPTHLNLFVALHEASHAICYRLYGEAVQPHGKEWLGIFLSLLALTGMYPKSALYASADAAGLKYVQAHKLRRKT